MTVTDGSVATPPGTGREELITLTGLVVLFAITAAWWALALWPVGDAPLWLERTRYVCFGVGDSGLPDGAGWLGLTAGPTGMLVILLAGWPRGFRELLRNARHSAPRAAALAALLAGVALMLAGAGWRVSDARAALMMPDAVHEPPATYPRLDRSAPALDLVAHDGSRRTLGQLRGRPVLVTFAFAHCTTVCPLVVQDALAAQEALRGTPSYPALYVLTLDPWRDTPSRLASMATSWKLPPGDAWVLGGEVAEVEDALTAWQVPRTRNETTGDVVHPALVYIIDADGRLAFAATGGADIIAGLLERL